MTASQIENPYAPPAAGDPGELPDAPVSSGWRLEGGKLWVRSEAVLPMVNLATGELQDRMTMMRIPVVYQPFWHQAILPIAMAGGLMVGVGTPIMGTVIGLTLGVFFRGLIGFVRPKCVVDVFLDTQFLRRRRIASTVLNVMIVAMIWFENEPWLPAGWAAWLMPVLLGVWAIGLVYMDITDGRITYSRMKDGWFELKGIHRRAIEKLATFQPGADLQS